MAYKVQVFITVDICGHSSNCLLPIERAPSMRKPRTHEGNHAQFPFAGSLLRLASALPTEAECPTLSRSDLYKIAEKLVAQAGVQGWSIGSLDEDEILLRSSWNDLEEKWDPVKHGDDPIHGWQLHSGGRAMAYISEEHVNEDRDRTSARMVAVICVQPIGNSAT